VVFPANEYEYRRKIRAERIEIKKKRDANDAEDQRAAQVENRCDSVCEFLHVLDWQEEEVSCSRRWRFGSQVKRGRAR